MFKKPTAVALGKHDEYIRKWFRRKQVRQIARHLGVGEMVVHGRARKIGLTQPPDMEAVRRVRKEKRDRIYATIREMYDKVGPGAVSRLLGIHPESLRRMAAEIGYAHGNLVKRKNNKTYDLTYFDKWTPGMAYVLGFMFADGSVQRGDRSPAVSVMVKRNDESVLQFMKKEIKVQKPIRRYEYGSTKPKRTSLLSISSCIVVEQLEKLGLVQNKTYKDMPFPKVPNEMFGHFVRGFLDGDGCISLPYNGNGICEVSFIGTPRFIRGLVSRLRKLAGITKKPIRCTKGKRATWATVCWCHPNDLRAFYMLMYPHGYPFGLERKRRRLYWWLSKKRVEMNLPCNLASIIAWNNFLKEKEA